MNENDASTLALKIQSFGLIAGWVLFTMFAVFPLFFVATIYFSDIFFSIYILIFIVFVLIMGLWKRFIMSSRFDFWIDVEVLDPFENAIFPTLCGCVMMIFLFWWFFMISGNFILELVYFICIAIVFLPIYYFLLRYRKQKSKGERLKYVRGKTEEVEKVVGKALDSLNLKYTRVKEGSMWTMLILSYKIKDSEISIRVQKLGRKEAIITIKVHSDSNIPKTREIEKTIGSLINIDQH